LYHDGAGRPDEGIAMLREAIQVAARAKDDRGAALAWSMLVQILSSTPKTTPEAASIEPAAVAAGVRVGDDPDAQHRLLIARAAVAMADHRPNDALALMQDAAEVPGIKDGDRREALENVAKLYYMIGKPKDALRVVEEALALTRKELGPAHPWVGDMLATVGQIQSANGLLDAAEASALEGMQIRRDAYGEVSSQVAESLQTLANIAGRRRDIAKAKELMEQAVGIHEQLPDKSGLPAAIGMLARYTEDAGDIYRRAMKVFEESGQVGSREYLEIAHNFASYLSEHGDCKSAMPIIDTVAAAFEAMAPPKLPLTLIMRGDCQVVAGDKAAAITTYDRAYTLCKQTDCGAAGLFLSAWPLGKLIAATGGDRARARELVVEARALLVADGAEASDLAEVDAWLRKH
jgi:tetratricopeptide (TPR) repeat protein